MRNTERLVSFIGEVVEEVEVNASVVEDHRVLVESDSDKFESYADFARFVKHVVLDCESDGAEYNSNVLGFEWDVDESDCWYSSLIDVE